MSKKSLMGLAPLLAVAAFAVMPAMASAATEAYGTCELGGVHSAECPTGEKAFTAFVNGTSVKVLTQKAFGSGNVILKDKVTGGVIECETLVNGGTVENVAGVGNSKETLIFNHCSTKVSATLTCPVNSTGAGFGDIRASVTNKVLGGGVTVEIKVTGIVTLELGGEPPAGCTSGAAVGKVTGSVTGTQARGSNKLVFNKAEGLKFNSTDETELTGEVETFAEATSKPVVIGPLGPIGWKVNGKFLKGAEELAVQTSGGPALLRTKNKMGTVVKEDACKTFIDKGKVGVSGADLLTTWEGKGCTQVFPAGACPLKIKLKGAVKSQLNESGSGVFIDTLKKVAIGVSIVNGACEVTGEEAVEGELVGEWSNKAHELAFPETPLEGSTLKSGENSVSLVANDDYELEAGGTLEVGEE